MVFTIENFEGPLDLLLHLIKEDNIDICDISIARITEQYLSYINEMQNMNLDIASEYLVMAAELIEFKSKTLLPNTNVEEVTEEFKEEIINKLYDYKEYKEFSENLKALAIKRSTMFDKAPSDCHEFVSYEDYKNMGSADDLKLALEKVLQNLNDIKPIETKANTNTEVVKDQQLENFTFKSTSLVYEEQTSTLQTVVTNTGSKVEMLSEFLIHVKDAEGNEIVTLTGFIGDSLKPGESRTITSSYGDDLTTAASISYEVVR